LRYQSAADVRTDLQRLKRDSDSRGVATAGAIVLVIGLAVGGWLFFSRKAHALTDKDTIVLADFANTTGDAIFDDALKTALNAVAMVVLCRIFPHSEKAVLVVMSVLLLWL
jgi:eukaryotic-like serine/threonine-protein kinase